MQAESDAAGAAVFGRKGQGEQAELLQQLEHVVRVLGRAVDLVGAGSDLLARDAPDQVLDRLLVVAQLVASQDKHSALPIIVPICEHSAK